MCIGEHPYIPVINTAKAELLMTQDGQQIETVFNVRKTDAWSDTDLATLGATLITWAGSYYVSTMFSSVTLNSVKVTDLSSQSGSVVLCLPDDPIVGGIATGEPLPNNVAVVIKWVTTQRGRSYRGRTYVPGLSTSRVIANTITDLHQTQLSGAASELWSSLRAAGWELVVVSYCNNKTWRTTGVATPITAWYVDKTVDSQRRRLPGRGK